MIDPNIGKNTQFTKTNQPKNNGRKPSSLKKFYKKNNIGALDKALLFENILNKHTAKELMEMVKTKNFPDGKPMSGLVWGFVVAWAADVKRGWSSGGINVIMMERKHGKTPDVIINKTDDEVKDDDVLNELAEMREKLKQEIRKELKQESQNEKNNTD